MKFNYHKSTIQILTLPMPKSITTDYFTWYNHS